MKKTFIISSLVVVAIVFSYFYLPVNRVGITSELTMLGDLNDDNKWDNKDKETLDNVLNNPFVSSSLTQLKIDINKNGLIDKEDLAFLEHMYKYSDPYLAEQKASEQRIYYPRPREFFKFLPKSEYIQRPLYSLNHDIVKASPLSFLKNFQIEKNALPYERQLLQEVYNESLRFSFAYALRNKSLTEVERKYAQKKIQYCEELFNDKKYFPLLLNLISLVEDAETLTITEQSEFLRNLLYFRDHLKELLISDDFASFTRGEISYSKIYNKMQKALAADLNISMDLNSLAPPRDFSNLQNYLDRAEWQAYKSSTKGDNFKQPVLYAQYDRRYLRSVSKTSPKLHDIQLQNHNLPMILLFREALKITNNDKKAAVALLDEAIRIPLGWVNKIPKELLPSSLAYDNFLLPGNKEDGMDKSRHWNVFGGVAIYKSPKESLILALKRENMDLKDQNFSPEAMQEFIRDTIANINGIYYVISINPNLISDIEEK